MVMQPEAWEPCSQLVGHVVPSPNFEARRPGFLPDLLLLHYTGMASADAAIRWLAEPQSKVSCHYVVAENGYITQMVPEAMRAWHAGVANWHNVSDINSCSIGIEIQNAGHENGYPDFPEQQILAVQALCRDIIGRHDMASRRVLAHSDVAPRRKIDPGEKFPWARLAQTGIGHFVSPAPIEPGDVLALDDCSVSVLRLQRQLRAYGYWIEANGLFDEHTEAVVTAFQRHFRPELVDGRADLSTVKTLDALLLSAPHD